jgi:tetratricopeptide (TPR) repeat protein
LLAAEPSASTVPTSTSGAPIAGAPAVSAPAVRIEPATFNGMRPGAAKLPDVNELWGRPIRTSREGPTIHNVYDVPPFERVEATFQRQELTSLVIHLRQAFDPAVLAEQLELRAIEPASVLDETGAAIGIAYPERGVGFAFVTGNQQQVARIIIEKITAEPFLLRAEARRQVDASGCLDDLARALQFAPSLSGALMMRAEVLLELGDARAAQISCNSALQQAPRDAGCRVVLARALVALGQYEEAVPVLNEALALASRDAETKARAVCERGNLSAARPHADFKRALDDHLEAIRLAEPLAAAASSVARRRAADLLLDAYLAAAIDVASGDWDGKSEAVPKWLERAAEVVGRSSPAHRPAHELRFCCGAVHACACAGGKVDPKSWSDELQRVGRERLAAARESRSIAALERRLGLAMLDAMEAFEARHELVAASDCGRSAVAHFERMIVLRSRRHDDALLLGIAYYRLGTMAAVAANDAPLAVTWFDRAVPLLEEAMSDASIVERGRQADKLASMAVSYWAVGGSQRAHALTRTSITWLEQAVSTGAADKQALAVVASNLAIIEKHLHENGSSTGVDVAERVDTTTRR